MGVLKYLCAGFLIDGENPVDGGRAAPRLREHNIDVCHDEPGLSKEDISRFS